MSGPSGPVGLLVVDKPGGITSHDVVARVRRAAGTRKVGHAGTLDPMATGVLLLGLGRATRLLGHLTLTEKTYTATIRLGETTSTDDAESDVASAPGVAGLSETALRAALAEQVGDVEQVPSAVSAIKVDGKRAYQRVRDGEDVALPARRVRIEAIEVHDVRPGSTTWDVDVDVRCSSGTYVRAIARDAGATLGTGGHLTALRRTAVGPFTLADAVGLDDLAGPPPLLEMDDAVRRCFSVHTVTDEQAVSARHGRPLPLDLSGLGAIYDDSGRFLALYEPRDGLARCVAGFVG